MNEVKNLLTDIYGKITDDEGNLVYKTREDCVEEIVANSMFDAFTNEKFVKKMMNENASLFGRIANKVKEVLADIRAAVRALGSKDAAIKALKDDIESLEKINTMFDSLLEKAGESYKAEHGAGQKNNADDGVKYSFGVTQEEINDYVDNAYLKNNREDYKKYAAPSNRLISDLKNDLNLDGYIHAFRDNDIRHIKNSHGEDTNEKYPVTADDIKKIPDIVQNYDKVYAKTNASGEPGIVYVKVGPENIVYYVEAVTTKYHNEKLLINKQMIKAGINEIPNLKGLIEAINKKESSSQYLADLQEIRKAYAQSVKENYSNNIIPNDSETVKQKLSVQTSKETLSELKEKREGLVAEYRELREQIDAIKESDEYKAFDNEVRTVRKNGSKFGGFEAVKAIRNRQKQCLLSVQSDFNCDKLWSNI